MVRETDDQGRVYLPKELREEHGDRYHLVNYDDRIELVPIADESMEAIREAAGELTDEDVEEIRAAVGAAADGDE